MALTVSEDRLRKVLAGMDTALDHLSGKAVTSEQAILTLEEARRELQNIVLGA